MVIRKVLAMACKPAHATPTPLSLFWKCGVPWRAWSRVDGVISRRHIGSASSIRARPLAPPSISMSQHATMKISVMKVAFCMSKVSISKVSTYWPALTRGAEGVHDEGFSEVCRDHPSRGALARYFAPRYIIWVRFQSRAPAPGTTWLPLSQGYRD